MLLITLSGSGKTTFMQRLNAHLHAQQKPPYILNLDPAVKNVPFESNIDIRDSVNYKEVMRQYDLSSLCLVSGLMAMYRQRLGIEQN